MFYAIIALAAASFIAGFTAVHLATRDRPFFVPSPWHRAAVFVAIIAVTIYLGVVFFMEDQLLQPLAAELAAVAVAAAAMGALGRHRQRFAPKQLGTDPSP